MKFTRYGITFRRIQKEDIEKVRQWRNSETIRQKMIYRKYITPEMQEKWFSGIEKSYHHSYYIIHFEGKDIGLFNQKNFRISGKMAESGIFIADEQYQSSHIPVIASLIMIEIFFFAMRETESFARVLKNNTEALNYNYELGYKIYKEEDNHLILRMTPESFLQKTKKLRKAIRNLYGDSFLEVFLEPIDFQLGYAPFFRDLILRIPEKFIEYKKETGNSLEIRININIE
jgi:RimJ/RimL family protein N-acetyltransferase